MTRIEQSLLSFINWALRVDENGISPTRLFIGWAAFLIILGIVGNADVEALNIQ